MAMFDAIVEQRIAAARDQGAFDDLPGAGKPLELDDERLVPEELRVAHRILRNAGFVPPEIDARNEVAGVHELLRHAVDDGERRRAVARLALLASKLEASGRALPPAYRSALLDKLGG
jgi:hypothetical protein